MSEVPPASDDMLVDRVVYAIDKAPFTEEAKTELVDVMHRLLRGESACIGCDIKQEADYKLVDSIVYELFDVHLYDLTVMQQLVLRMNYGLMA